MPNENDFAARLFQIRKERGFSQKELGDKVGFSHQMVSLYETGRVEPTLFNIQNLCIALGVTASELLGF